MPRVWASRVLNSATVESKQSISYWGSDNLQVSSMGILMSRLPTTACTSVLATYCMTSFTNRITTWWRGLFDT